MAKIGTSNFMRGVLLDTNVIIWLAEDSKKLGSSTRQLVLTSGTIYISSISVFETTIKVMLRKLRLPGEIEEVRRSLGAQYLDVTADHALTVRSFPDLTRHDPFDRLLLAQATQEGLVLVTADETLLALGLEYVQDARR